VRIVNHLPPSGETINLVRPAEIKKKGATEAETASRMVEYIDMKDATPQLFQVENEIARMCLSLRASNDDGFSKLQKFYANSLSSNLDRASAITFQM
jgi:hypothetical protein